MSIKRQTSKTADAASNMITLLNSLVTQPHSLHSAMKLLNMSHSGIRRYFTDLHDNFIIVPAIKKGYFSLTSDVQRIVDFTQTQEILASYMVGENPRRTLTLKRASNRSEGRTFHFIGDDINRYTPKLHKPPVMDMITKALFLLP
jgi:hypothetical protein